MDGKVNHAPFTRGLCQDFVDQLNEMYESCSWWSDFVKDEDLFFGIRDNSVNVYYRGNSLLKLKWQNGNIIGETHYKYLLKPRKKSKYIKIETVNGKACLSDTKCLFVDDLTNVEDIKKAAEPYAGPEKEGVHDIILANPNILDVEIAFGIPGTDEEDRSVPRVDFSALQPTDQNIKNIKIVFFEAKHFTNKELRASNKKVPKVVDQIEKYARLLQKHDKEIIESYRQVCRNLRDLQGLDEKWKCTERHAMIKGIADGSKEPSVCKDPRLVVFGFDTDQRDGKCKELEDKLEKCGVSVLLRGNSKGFTRGISTKG